MSKILSKNLQPILPVIEGVPNINKELQSDISDGLSKNENIEQNSSQLSLEKPLSIGFDIQFVGFDERQLKNKKQIKCLQIDYIDFDQNQYTSSPYIKHGKKLKHKQQQQNISLNRSQVFDYKSQHSLMSDLKNGYHHTGDLERAQTEPYLRDIFDQNNNFNNQNHQYVIREYLVGDEGLENLQESSQPYNLQMLQNTKFDFLKVNCLNMILDMQTGLCKNCNQTQVNHQLKISYERSSGMNMLQSELYLNIDSQRSRQDFPGTFSEKIQNSLRIKSNKSGQSKFLKNTLDLLNIQAKTFFCNICYLDVDISDIMVIKCGHYFCKSCLQGFLDFMINQSGLVYKMKCPTAGCEKTFDKEELKSLLSEDNYHKFQKFMANYEVSKSANKCFCPQIDCETIVEGKKGQTKSQCPNCTKYFCFQCQLPWHDGLNCKEAQAEVYKDWALHIGAHQCPNCKAPVQKDKGCHHMNCIVCNYKWCWVCGNSLDHWIHKFEYLPFNCSKAPKNKKNQCYFLLMFFVGLIFMPLFIYLLILGFCVHYGIQLFFKAVDKCKACDRIFGCMCMFPIFFTYICLVICISAGIAALSAVVFLLPGYYVHFYGYMSTYRWWKKSSRVKRMTQLQIAGDNHHQQNNAQQKLENQHLQQQHVQSEVQDNVV